MKNKLLFLFVLVTILSSCQKESQGEFIQESFLPNLISSKSNLSIVATSYSYADQSPYAIDIMGSFVDDNDNLIDIDELIVGGIPINKGEDKRYLENFNVLSDKDNYSTIVESMTGTDVELRFNDKKFGELQTEITVADPIKLQLPKNHQGILRKSEGIAVKWNPDSNINNNAKSEGDELVVAAVTYHSGLSQRIDPGLPSENITVKKTVQDVSGEVYFSPEELSGLPTNGIIIIYIGRGEQVVVEYAAVENIISYLTYSSSQELVVTE